MAKARQLSDIELKELSLVKEGANGLKFLFAKQQVGKKLKKKINIVIDSDGTVGGTKISVNKEALTNLRSFDFSFWGTDDPKRAVSCSYGKFVEDNDGFSRQETFYLSKGDSPMKKEVQTQLQAYFGEDAEVDFEKAADGDVLTKSLAVVTSYKGEFPDDLEKAVGIIALQAGMYEPVQKSDGDKKKDDKEDKEGVEKAGAKFSKETLAKLQTLVEAIKAFETVLPKDEKDKTEKSADGTNDENTELRKTIESLQKSIEAVGEKKDGTAKDDALKSLTKSLKDLGTRLVAVEEGTGIRKSLEEEPEEENDDGTPVKKKKKLWPSFSQ